MNKVLGWVMALFFVLVGANYLFTMVGNFFAGGGFAHAQSLGATSLLHPASPAVSAASGLASINFNFFDEAAAGKDYLTQGYGYTPYSYLYIDGWHNGIDIAAQYGAPIYSPTEGVVLATANQDNYCPGRAFGKLVVVDDTANHLILMFAHLGTIAVAPGTLVEKGTELGSVGASGEETGPHLHFSIFKEVGFSMAPAHGCGPYPQGNDMNPLNYLGTTY